MQTIIKWPDGQQQSVSNLWLRDHCFCPECRIEQSAEKRFHVRSVDADIAPRDMSVEADRLSITWPDGHRSSYERELFQREYTRHADQIAACPWGAEFVPPRIDFGAFLDDDDVAKAALTDFLAFGVIVLQAAPNEAGTVELLAKRCGPIRDIVFGRVHDVHVDPTGYNVAHTSEGVPPHNDFPSYSWPPSMQALHMLENDAKGGESIVVDGLQIVRSLDSETLDVLSQFRVPFRQWDSANETFATEPLIALDIEGQFRGLRYSNQLTQALDPFHPATDDYYRAYRALSEAVFDPANAAEFRLAAGDVLIVAGQRVLHGRRAFEAAGKRFLQDAYFEHDNLRNHLAYLQR
ncbi:MAG: TauD/TfdA family dioxygenase [Pseudomonadota bacterium]